MTTEQPKLNEWQATRIEEVWVREGIRIESSRLEHPENPESSFGSFSSSGDATDLDLSKYDTPADLLADGWKVESAKASVAELMPFETYHSLTEEICKLFPQHPDEATAIKIKGLLKRYVHIEKHGVYSRMDMYFGEYIPEHARSFLTGKIETHREFSRKSIDDLGTKGY